MGWNLLRMNGVRQKVYLCIFLSIMIALLSPMHLDILLVISIYRWSFISHLLLIDHLIYIYFIKEPGSHELPTFYVAHLREPVSEERMHYLIRMHCNVSLLMHNISILLAIKNVRITGR